MKKRQGVKEGKKNRLGGILAALITAALFLSPCASFAAEGGKTFAEGRILVKLARTEKREGAARTLTARNAAGTRIAGMTVAKSWDFSSPLAKTQTGGAARALSANAQESATIALLVSDSMTTEQMLEAAAGDPSIEYAEPDYKIYPASLPNDPGASEQWAYNDEARRPTGGGAHLDIAGAWDSATSSPPKEDVVVAVVDIGVDYGHPDLAANMWDGAGFGYPNHGWDSSQEKDSSAYLDPMDKDGHGTHVAGIIAAEAGNGEGVTGAARNVKIIAAKVFGATDGFSSAIVDTYNNLLELKARGVNIVATNNSWSAPILSKTAGEAMEALGKAGVVNVIAAANDHSDNDTRIGFPFNLASEHSIIVAASTPWDELAEFSNYGRRSVHIAAPGAWILSTFSRKAANPERYMLENSFVKAFAEKQEKLFYHRDFTASDGLTPGPGQSVSTDDGYLVWTVTAGSAGTYRLRVDADIDLKSVNSESGSEFKDNIYINVLYMSDHSFGVSLCAQGEDGEVNRDPHNMFGNFNYDGNFWKSHISQIADPYWYDPDFSEGWPRESEAELVWNSDSAYVEFSIDLDAGETRTVKVKEIAITTGTPYDPDAPYRYMSGTSMASPAVAGSLALVAAQNPETTPAELRARMIGGAVKIPSMAEKLLTGGRLSVKKALEAPSPVINSVSVKDGLMTAEGFFFGESGALTISSGGTTQKLEAASWSDGTITAELTEAPSGWSEITVTRADGGSGRKITELTRAATQWKALAPLPEIMHKASLAADEENGAIYIAGCHLQDTMSPLFASYDIAADKWQVLEDLPREIYAAEDEYGNDITSSLGIGFTVWNGAPAVVRNYGGSAVTAAIYDGGIWQTVRITDDDVMANKMPSYEKILFAAPASDGDSLLLVTSSAALWRLRLNEGKLEKLADVPELQDRSISDAMFSAKDGTIAVFGGKGENAAQPVFLDGETVRAGSPCHAPENGVFSWTGAAFGWYGDFLVVLEGAYNTAETIGNGAYYDINADEWISAPTERASIRIGGASAVVGDDIYRAAISDYFNGVTNEFERLSLKADAPEPLPDDPAQGEGSGGGCSSGFAALALFAAVPLIFARKRK